MDLHQRRSVLVRMTGDGRKLETARITNSPAELRGQIARAGEHPMVVLDARDCPSVEVLSEREAYHYFGLPAISQCGDTELSPYGSSSSLRGADLSAATLCNQPESGTSFGVERVVERHP